jgi:GT2 family glycosyltransferase
MPEYMNPHPHDLYLVGPDGNTVHIRRGRRVRLPEFFDRYVNKSGVGSKGYLVNISQDKQIIPPPLKLKTSRQAVKPVRVVYKESKDVKPQQMVGRMRSDIDRSASKAFTSDIYAISNGVGVGILTYNRPSSLRRLVDSIIKHTDTSHTTIFISDDGSTDPEQLSYLSELELRGDIVVLKNKEQLGIAGNSNRLLRCLSRFPKKILLNDDVEILNIGWENHYFIAMRRSNFHHFCYRQPGVYGATKGRNVAAGDVILSMVDDKPQGAVMAFDHIAFSRVGYFDEQFGQYGVEHVDWSTRLSNSQLQQPGFYDVDGSEAYFLVHSEPSAVKSRVEKLKYAKSILSAMETRPTYINVSGASVVPCISCVIPFRDIGRKDCIFTVLNNIRSQCFPDIEIIMTEEDVTSKIDDLECLPAKHIFTAGRSGAAFNKSRAWNAGVAICEHEMLVLHDADTLVPRSYFKSVATELSEVESCHLCKNIYYINTADTNIINTSGSVNQPRYDYMVDYFEGGTIACSREVYWKIGGFVEEYVGYGVEDNDFYARLSKTTIWHENRYYNLLHLHHDRTDGWIAFHQRNKDLGTQLSALSIQDRIDRQRKALINSGRGHLIGE